MYIRFQGRIKNERADSFLGIFQLAFQLRDNMDLEKHYEAQLIENLAWLKEHLKSPKPLREDENFRALSWFKPQAQKPLKRIRAIVAVLQEHGYVIDTLKSSDPGIIIYEDGWQVVAKPGRSAK